MNGFNKIFLLGHIGSPPEAKTSQDGHPYVRLNLATHRRFKNKNEQWEEKTDWHSIYVWGKQRDLCCKHLVAGVPVFVEGYLSYYQNNCQQVINAVNIEFLPIKNKL